VAEETQWDSGGHAQSLGGFLPKEKPYAEKYPLRTIGAVAARGNPVVLGINWYSRFDTPTLDDNGRWWAAKPGDDLGKLRGGHDICVKSNPYTDNIGWWTFYDQKEEGACVGFAWSRVMSLFNRYRYDAFWLYHEAQKIDPWPGESYEGTSTDAAAQVLKKQGHRIHTVDGDKPVDPAQGISAYRWTTDVNEIHIVLNMPLSVSLHAVPLLNSWGRYGYPHITWMPDVILNRLLKENGECCIPTDR
jgi:hypothetical protein